MAGLKVDITLKITPEIASAAPGKEDRALVGHWGTHFDVMDKEFPLDYTVLPGLVFDVSAVSGRDIEPADIDMARVRAGMFVAFYSGFIEAEGYGSKRYFKEHPQLSVNLIEALLQKEIAVIGLDFAGVRRGKEHTPMDQHCADRNVFVVENLCNLAAVVAAGGGFTAHTYPLNYSGISGLPCRVVAEI